MTHNSPEVAREFDGLARLAQARRLARSPDLSDDAASAAPTPPDKPSEAAAQPFQFRLRTMLALVAAASGLLAVMHVVGSVWSAILIWFLVLAMAHVTANFWGTRVAPGVGRSPAADLDAGGRASRDYRSAPIAGAVKLSESSRPGWPMFAATAAGVCIGGCLGGVALVILSLERAGYAGVIVGSLSAAAVGGFVGFLTSSFIEIALRAWNEAIRGARATSAAPPEEGEWESGRVGAMSSNPESPIPNPEARIPNPFKLGTTR